MDDPADGIARPQTKLANGWAPEKLEEIAQIRHQLDIAPLVPLSPDEVNAAAARAPGEPTHVKCTLPTGAAPVAAREDAAPSWQQQEVTVQLCNVFNAASKLPGSLQRMRSSRF